MLAKTIFAAVLLAGLAQAQGTHNVVLMWTDTGNAAGTVTYNVYKAPGACPAPGTDPKTVTPPFSQAFNGAPNTNYTDVNAIGPGQSWCYYVTAVSGFIVNPTTGLVTPNESGPSNYAVATLLATNAPPPLAPTAAKAMLQ